MDMHILQSLNGEDQAANYVGLRAINPCSREELIRQLREIAQSGRLQAALRMLTDYVGASHYLLARSDLLQEAGLDFIVSSDWPFDLAKDLAATLANSYGRTTELEKCMQLFQPNFAFLPDSAAVPDGASRQYCSLTFNVGRSRMSLMFLFDDGFVLSPERLRDGGLRCRLPREFSSVRRHPDGSRF